MENNNNYPSVQDVDDSNDDDDATPNNNNNPLDTTITAENDGQDNPLRVPIDSAEQDNKHHHHHDDDDELPIIINDVLHEPTENDNNDNATTSPNMVQIIATQRYYVTHAPNWRARRRRQTNVTTCAVDVAQRLDAAATDLMECIQAAAAATPHAPKRGMTLPVTAWAWLLAWWHNDDDDDNDGDSAASLTNDATTMSILQQTQVCAQQQRQWKALARYTVQHLHQIRLVNEPWPAVRQVRNRAWQPPENWNDNNDTQAAAAAWLQAHYAWQTRPLVNLQTTFGNHHQQLTFGWMDAVPPEFVVPCRTWRVWRVQRAAVPTLSRLVGIAHPPGMLSFPVLEHLTHLKLDHCELLHLTHGDDDDDDGNNQPLLPITCPQLQSLHLPHNRLTDAAISAAGLDQLVHLQGVNLAHNALRGTWQCGPVHWARLDVSYNQIHTIGRGLLQLYGLVHLDLRYNGLDQLSRVARLARLPLLQDLYLHGNVVTQMPNQRQGKLARRQSPPPLYQQVLWDLFREARHGDVHDLPRLDGCVAPTTSSSGATTGTSRPMSTTRPPVPVPVVRTNPSRRPVVMDCPLATLPFPPPRSTTTSGAARVTLQSAAVRAPLVLAATTTTTTTTSEQGACVNHQQVCVVVDFDAWKVLESLPQTTVTVEEVVEDPIREPVEEAQEPIGLPLDDQDDPVEIVAESDDNAGEVIKPGKSKTATTISETLDGSTENESPTSSGVMTNDDVHESSSVPVPAKNIIPSSKETEESVWDSAAAKQSLKKALVEPSKDADGVQSPSQTSSLVGDVEQQEEETRNESDYVARSKLPGDSTVKGDPDQASAVSSVATSSNTAPEATKSDPSSTNVTSAKSPAEDSNQSADTLPENTKLPASPIRKPLVVQRSMSSMSASASEPRSCTKTPSTSNIAGFSPHRHADPCPSSMGSPQRTSFHVAFPDHVWQDETNSIAQSSTVLSYPDTAASEFEEVKIYELAENKSTFVGPHTYKALSIRENLELYFRLFVFSQAVPSMSSLLDSSMEGDWLSILESYPRIQLWPIDRRLRDATTTPESSLSSTPQMEAFCRVWMENVVACGKPALRRLTPNLTARLGFHGELMWSTNAVHLRQEAVSTHRRVILCFSSAAFYVILDHDAVTEKAKNQKRRFPLPLAVDACFAEAKWPHALARHPFSMLRKVIIGFGFQRLTLRFSNSSYPSPEDFTYVLMTCNKLTTVSILKDIQEMASEAKDSTGFDQLVIENDDFQVLEALGTAVAPDVIGVVLHYQILEQRWKHGDRPNVRRVLVVSDTNIYLLDEDYLGDGAKKDTTLNVAPEQLGLPRYRLVDSAALSQIGQLHTGTDPTMITLVIRPPTRLSRTRNWRLVCRDREGKERLVEDVRKAISSSM